MDKENAILKEGQELNEESFDFDELEAKLESQLEDELADLEFLEEEKEKIGSPDNLGEVIKNVVWEQFINQIAVTAGEDFIKENHNLHLDLRKEAHIQTTENFAEGKFVTHNFQVYKENDDGTVVYFNDEYRRRYDEWQANFVKDENGNVVTHKTRSGKEEATLVKKARDPFDNGRPSGSAEKHTDMDHTISAAEIIRDPAANAHLTKDEQIAFANSSANLNEIDSSLNRSKSDKSMTDWLDNPNAKGQKPNEIFDISAEEEKKLRQKDAEAREEYEKIKSEGEKISVETGKRSQKQEAVRITKETAKAIRAVIIMLLTELIKDLIAKLIKWFKSAQKKLDDLLTEIKNTLHSFVKKLVTKVSDTAITAIATAIFGPVIGTIKKVLTMLKQGWKSLKEAIAYIKNPENKGKPVGILILEVGKIVMAGLSAVGAILLGEAIEKGLIAIPGIGAALAFEIPLLGSIANILGIFLGAVVAGIIGAIAINMIEKAIEKQKKAQMTSEKIDKGNEILTTQNKLLEVKKEKIIKAEKDMVSAINQRHAEAANIIRESVSNVLDTNNYDNTENLEKINQASKECDSKINNINNLLDLL